MAAKWYLIGTKTRKNVRYNEIIKKAKLKINNNKELENYYEGKYNKGGYRGGFIVNGINITKIYNNERSNRGIKMLNPQKNEIILDAGCGKGDFSLRISKKAKQVYGVDIAKNAFPKKHPKNVFFKRTNLENTKFKDNFFDKIICIETLEHVLHPEKVISEFSRILKKGGEIVLIYPTNNTNLTQKIHIALRIWPPVSISEHLNEYDYSTLKKLFAKYNLKTVKAEGIFFDAGILCRAREISRFFTKLVTYALLKIKSFPRNSSWVLLKLQKV